MYHRNLEFGVSAEFSAAPSSTYIGFQPRMQRKTFAPRLTTQFICLCHPRHMDADYCIMHEYDLGHTGQFRKEW